MARPNSLTTRLRRWAVRKLVVGPDPGEAWCMWCQLNGGKTAVVSASGYLIHVAEHRESIAEGGDHTVDITGSWPPE